jgi:hypothetical protein
MKNITKVYLFIPNYKYFLIDYIFILFCGVLGAALRPSGCAPLRYGFAVAHTSCAQARISVRASRALRIASPCAAVALCAPAAPCRRRADTVAPWCDLALPL